MGNAGGFNDERSSSSSIQLVLASAHSMKHDAYDNHIVLNTSYHDGQG